MNIKTTFKHVNFVAVLILAALFSGCDVDGEGPTPVPGTPQTVTGILSDSPVGGAAFTTPTQSGFTSAAGEFTYQQGESVTFSIGDISLGTVAAAPVITPVELTANADPTAQSAVNMMVFLQSIDLDSNPDNGITVNGSTTTASIGQSLSFNSPTFATDVNNVVGTIAPGKTVVADQAALDNFYEAYKQLGGSSTFSWPFPGFPDFPGPPVDLLENGSFETPATSTDTACTPGGATVAGWDCFNASFAVSAGVNAPASVSGTRVLKQFGADGGARQEVVGLPGNTYTASAWMQNYSGDPLTALVLLQLSFLDSGGQVISQQEVFGNPVDDSSPDHTLLPSNTWVQLSLSGVAPSGTAKVLILLIHLNVDASTGNPVAGGSVFMDDVMLTGPEPVQAPPEPVVDLVTNGTFESPDASSVDQACADTWSCFNSSFTVSNNGPGIVPTAHGGSQVLKQFGADGGAFQDITVIPGETYTASVWAQNYSGDPLNNLVGVQLFFLDGSGSIIGGQPAAEQFGMPDPAFLTTEVLLSPDTWAEIVVEAVAPSNALNARLQLIHFNVPVTGNPGGAVFWDDVTLIGPGSGLSLVWSEEFNAAALDQNTWNIETGYGPNNSGWGNDEWQMYTTDSNNVSIVTDPTNTNNSFLNISAQCPTAPTCGKRDGSITSARITTKDKFEFRFGRVEARIQPPGGLGTWPAFWMLGAQFPNTAWPKAGEIDILEVFDNKSEASSAMHWCDETLNLGCDFPNGYRFVANALNTGSSLANDFHIFEMEWDAAGVTTSVDGTEYFSTTIQPGSMEEFLEDFFFLLNVAIGGNPVADPGPSLAWPQTMLVDYIRVFQ